MSGAAPAAIVTGASRGIGMAIARALLEAGHTVTITGRDEEALAAAQAELGGAERVLAVAGNSGDADHRAHAVDATVERFGSLDALVNNAGINPLFGPLAEADLGAFEKTFRTNVVASLGWVQEALRGGIGSGGGAIVNVASVAGLRPAAALGAYGASKAALIQLTRQLALELAPRTRVNAVAPAVVQTRFAKALYEGREDDATAVYPLGRLGRPDDVAGAVEFLLSPRASWITGETIVMDGGLLAGGGLEE